MFLGKTPVMAPNPNALFPQVTMAEHMLGEQHSCLQPTWFCATAFVQCHETTRSVLQRFLVAVIPHTLRGASPSLWYVLGPGDVSMRALPCWDSSCAVPFLLCRLLKEQEEKENKIASLIAEQSDEK